MSTAQLELDLAEIVTPEFSDPALPDRFWVKVSAVPSGCWIWTAAKAHGYGRFKFGDRIGLAHRIAYEALVAAIPDGLHLDHLCRNRACVNPEHLEPVTCRENILRGIGPSAMHAVKTRCPSGHEYTDANTYLYRGMRMCRTCRAELRSRRTKSRAAAQVNADPSDRRHGTLTAYYSYGCRCADCRAAGTDYQRERRARTG